MNIRKTIKESFLITFLIHLRYFINRYIARLAFQSAKTAEQVNIKPIDYGICFFGYYNISPSNHIGDILYLKVGKENFRGSLNEAAKIMLKRANGSIQEIADTRAWNWQQGCMLQWFPRTNDQLIYNDYDEVKDKYVSKVINTEGELLMEYSLPVNNVSKCGQFALSLNYDRLKLIRPAYGYFNRKNKTLPPDDSDGIWYLDLNKGKVKLIISLEDLKSLSYVSSMNQAIHKVNHIDINPVCSRFMFLHRWIGPKGRFMRLITADPDGSNLYILNGDEMTSHCCWLNNQQILSYCEYHKTRGYFVFTDQSEEVRFFSNKMPKIDGHPSVSPDGECIITDTYPDKSRMSSLYLYNIKNNKTITVGRFHQPLRYKKEIRIDLHPKWSSDGESIFFESGHKGNRQLYKIDLTSVYTLM